MQQLHHTVPAPRRSPNRLALSALLLLVGLVSSAAPGWGAVVRRFNVTNNSGAARSDVHLVFTGSLGDTATALLAIQDQPGLCGPAIIQRVTGGGLTWDITWPSLCVQSGQVVVITVTTATTGVTYSSGTWTPGNVALSGGDVVLVTVPGLAPWSLGLLVLLIAAAGASALAVRRRRESRAEGGGLTA